MTRFNQVLFAVSLTVLSWLAMMAVHEFGHVLGAFATGGVVERVVLHPLTISRTDVSPNPSPGVVVWFGPILGCAIPVLVWVLIPKRLAAARKLAAYFAGFCLIANGAYIGIGSLDRVGDCGVMLKHGSAVWLLIVFATVAVPFGLYLWHRIGSIKQFLNDPSLVDAKMAYGCFVAMCVVMAIEFTFSPR